MREEVALHVFGDESQSNNLVTYGLVALAPSDTAAAWQDVECCLRAHGGTREAQLHCRELFHPHPRAKSGWAHLDEEGAYRLALDVARSASARARFLVGVVDRSQLPKRLPSDHRMGPMRLGVKQLSSFAFTAAAEHLDGDPGFEAVRLWVDPDRTKIDWAGRRRRADRGYRMYGLAATQADAPLLAPEPLGGEKPALLQIADLLAYSSARALSQQLDRGKPWFEAIHRALSPSVQEFKLYVDPIGESTGCFRSRPPS